jgi:hypothetical protein
LQLQALGIHFEAFEKGWMIEAPWGWEVADTWREFVAIAVRARDAK